jgi:fibronectin-binding autotransporter adhesin
LYLGNSTVRDNFGHMGSGGGIAIAKGTVTIWKSTISGNRSSYGGGIYNGIRDQGGSLYITNSTISGNKVLRDGGYAGGILNAGVGNAWLKSVTITENTAPYAGGVYGQTSSGVFHFWNTIIAGNTATAKGEPAPDCFAIVVTLGGNLLGDTKTCDVRPGYGDQASDVRDKKPMLDPLADNGGHSCTHQLLDGSPAINAAWPDAPGSSGFACEAFDQRGAARKGRCDIGAYEFNALTPGPMVCKGLK